MDKFTLNIDLGNEAMSTPNDVRNALLYVANQLDSYRTPGCVWGEYDFLSHSIRDMNGYRVGEWLVGNVKQVTLYIRTLLD